MRLQVTLIKSVNIEVEVPDDFDATTKEGEDLFNKKIDEFIDGLGKEQGFDKHTIVSNITCPEYPDDEDLLELCD